ncbi:MAG: chitobiase/beta-hexosaminidase C-terminal domain-containing protein [Butyrivibrio sp.]|nr:chitobiase/beta-hexosaminidase C-terminal domain-containing protein [Butyrivibrio sp.]
MKCPNCGFEIPEGHMYCDNCGKEINFVPDFEPEVENEINETLSGVADELNKEARLKEERRKKMEAFFDSIKKRRHIIVMSLTAIIVLIVIISLLSYFFTGESAHTYLRDAEKAKNSGNVDEAITILTEGNEIYGDNSDIIFRLSDYYLEQGKTQEAVDTLRKITDSSLFPEQTVSTAYESIISIYEQNRDFVDISAILNEGDNEAAQALRDKYVPSAPIISPASGEFEDYVNVSIAQNTSEGFSNIYYTVNDGDPDENSIHYESDIVIDSPGEYNVKAVCINQYGIASEITECRYIVSEGLPNAPEIMEPSGDYNQNTMIVAVAEEGCTIFYTTNGKDPDINSKQYISPISMPVGTSHFKFVAINADGEMSEIVERDYHLVFTRLYSTEQAVTLVLSTLVRLDYLLDNTGKVRGQDGVNQYIYDKAIEIEGAGEYYVIVEYHLSYDGVATPTGLLYAVNTHDGSVNRLGYDSSGKYTLLKISNR